VSVPPSSYFDAQTSSPVPAAGTVTLTLRDSFSNVIGCGTALASVLSALTVRLLPGPLASAPTVACDGDRFVVAFTTLVS